MSKLSIADIKNILDDVPLSYLEEELGKYKEDSRVGVQNLIERYLKKVSNYQQELERLVFMRTYENKYTDKDYICGIDEAGRGPLAGPVVSAAVILPKDVQILYVNDSKKLSQNKRDELFDEIYEKAISVSVGISSVDLIDDINILKATFESMKSAINKLKVKPDVLLVDAVTIPDIDIEQEPIIKGDAKSMSIAAASIIAKVTRDRMMMEYDELFPEYAFAKNKGYGTSDHINALKKYGPCSIHRKTFIKSILELDK